jgi:hypothetical protein
MEIENVGKGNFRSKSHLDDQGIYLPPPELIAAHCARFRARDLRRKRQSPSMVGHPGPSGIRTVQHSVFRRLTRPRD